MVLSVLFFIFALVALVETDDIYIFCALVGLSALWSISGNLHDIVAHLDRLK